MSLYFVGQQVRIVHDPVAEGWRQTCALGYSGAMRVYLNNKTHIVERVYYDVYGREYVCFEDIGYSWDVRWLEPVCGEKLNEFVRICKIELGAFPSDTLPYSEMLESAYLRGRR